MTKSIEYCNPLAAVQEGSGSLPAVLIHAVDAQLKGWTLRAVMADVLTKLKPRKDVEKDVIEHRRRMIASMKEYALSELDGEDVTNAELMGWTDETFDRFVHAKLVINTSPHASFNTPTPNELKYEMAHTLMGMNDDAFLINTTLTTNTLLETKYSPRQLIIDGRAYQLVRDLKQRGNQIMLKVETDGIDPGAEMLLREFIKAYKVHDAIAQKFSTRASTKGLSKLHQQGDKLKASTLPSGVMRAILDHGAPELNALQFKNLAYASTAFRARIFRKLFPHFKNRWIELPLDIVVRGNAAILGNVEFVSKLQNELRTVHEEFKSKGFSETGLEAYVNQVSLEGEVLGQPSLFRYITRKGYLKDLFVVDGALFTADDLKKGLEYTDEALTRGLEDGYIFIKVPLLLYVMHLLGIDVMIGGPSQAGSYHQMLRACDAVGLTRRAAYVNAGKAALKPMPKPKQLPPKGIGTIQNEGTMWEADLLSYHLCGKGRAFLENAMDIPYEVLAER